MRPALPLLATLVLLAAACGPRTPGPHPNETLLFRIDTSELQFGECTDLAEFRDDFEQVPGDGSRFMAFGVDGAGQTATMLRCDGLQTAQCSPAQPERKLEVAGHSAALGMDFKNPIATTGCSLAQAHSWVLEDSGDRMVLTITDSFTLMDSTSACAEVESSARQQSPNGKGLEGCTVVRTLAGPLVN